MRCALLDTVVQLPSSSSPDTTVMTWSGARLIMCPGNATYTSMAWATALVRVFKRCGGGYTLAL